MSTSLTPIQQPESATPEVNLARSGNHLATRVAAVIALVLGAAIFGFFYAWVCSTMWGLDAADPRVAIAAMQEMNASVRNPVFFLSFFVTPVAWGVTALLAWQATLRRAAVLFAIAGLVYLFGALLLTAFINVPMNEALGQTPVPTDVAAAEQVWNTYSSTWQSWNITRTFTSGISFVIGVLGFGEVMRHSAAKVG